MQLEAFPVIEPLRDYIAKIWLYKSNEQVGDDDLKMIVPNGRFKLIIPFNDVVTRTGMSEDYYVGNKIFLIGITDVPRIINDQKQNPSGTIGLEFKRDAAYRFFHLDFESVVNQILPLSGITGDEVGVLEQALSHAASVDTKVELLQAFLLRLLSPDEDRVFNHCIKMIEASRGQITMPELEKATGYGSRWLNMKFKERLGISPNKFAGIIRFHELYKSLNTNPFRMFSQKEFYDIYHDQSHFIRDFKKFAGMPPTRLSKAVNDFGRTFFKD